VATQNTAYWIERLEARDLLCGPVKQLGEALEDPQTAINGMLIRATEGDLEFGLVGSPVHLSDDGFSLRYLPPGLGADGDAILSEAGFDAGAIAQLRADRIIA
jgi:formyl-CoA transferase